jgi:hypothetical protein
VNVRSCMFPPPINTPVGFAGGPEPLPPTPVAEQGYGQQDTSFGETYGQRSQNVSHTNPNINLVIKALCDKACQVDPSISMQGLLRGSNVTLGQLVLVDGNCVDFHSFGMMPWHDRHPIGWQILWKS